MNNLVGLNASLFRELSQLKNVRFSHNRINQLDIIMFDDLPYLEFLDLSYNTNLSLINANFSPEESDLNYSISNVMIYLRNTSICSNETFPLKCTFNLKILSKKSKLNKYFVFVLNFFSHSFINHSSNQGDRFYSKWIINSEFFIR